MQMKCSITKEPCPAAMQSGEKCPIRKYKGSSYYYRPGENTTGARGKIDDTCRFYGIKRAQDLENKNFMEE